LKHHQLRHSFSKSCHSFSKKFNTHFLVISQHAEIRLWPSKTSPNSNQDLLPKVILVYIDTTCYSTFWHNIYESQLMYLFKIFSSFFFIATIHYLVKFTYKILYCCRRINGKKKSNQARILSFVIPHSVHPCKNCVLVINKNSWLSHMVWTRVVPEARWGGLPF